MVRMFFLAALFAATSAHAEDLKSEALRRCSGVERCVDAINNGTLEPAALIACFAAINRPSSPDYESNNKICRKGLKKVEEANRRIYKSRR